MLAGITRLIWNLGPCGIEESNINKQLSLPSTEIPIMHLQTILQLMLHEVTRSTSSRILLEKESIGCYTSEEIPQVLRKQKVHYGAYKNQTLVLKPSQRNQVHMLLLCSFYSVLIYLIIPFARIPLTWDLFGFSGYCSVRISYFSHASYFVTQPRQLIRLH
jgi:hypothetical protein